MRMQQVGYNPSSSESSTICLAVPVITNSAVFSQIRCKRMHQEVLFLIPARITLPFFTRLYAECERAIFRRFQSRFRPILRAINGTEGQFDESTLVETLVRELKFATQLTTIVICPTESIALASRVRDLATQHDLRVIALTLPFRRWPVEPARPQVVLCNSGKAVEAIADAAVAELAYFGHKEAFVMAVPGNKTRSDSKFRIRRFLSGFRKAATDNNLVMHEPVLLPECQWDRSQAYHRFLQHVQSAGSLTRLDVVFAANDEMALGARDAILELCHSRTYRSKFSQTQIFGFDGIPEARTLIKESDPFFRGTVVQDYRGLAEQLAEVIANEEGSEQRVFPVEPEIELQMRTTGRHFAIAYPRIPPYAESDPRWISAKQAAAQRRVSLDGLKKARERGENTIDGFGTLGRDTAKQIWRRDGKKRIFYLRSTLLD